MRNLIAFIGIFFSACATDPAWLHGPEATAVTLGKTVEGPNGGRGNCLPVAFELQNRFGGRVVILSHPRTTSLHAVVMFDDDTILDNGYLGYKTTWEAVQANGWKLEGER